MSIFHLKTSYKPTGDQPQAIKKLVNRIQSRCHDQVLLGVTGSGKTFTIANVIQKIGRPTLIISHNKTLAAQLFQEFREFFPQNAVHYFVSYYDYYQPEAYLPTTDTYIDKDAKINEEIDRLRYAATQAIMVRQDVIIVASVSCIYGLGSPRNYSEIALTVRKNEQISQQEVIKALISLLYERTQFAEERGKFKVLGEVIYIYPVSSRETYKIEWSGNTIIGIEIIPSQLQQNEFSKYLLGTKKRVKAEALKIFPAKHFVMPQKELALAIANIKAELSERVKFFKKKKKFLEAQRIQERTNYDLEMLAATGYCHGIENYSRHLDFRKKGQPPSTLVDYFNFSYAQDASTSAQNEKKDASLRQKAGNGWLLVIDESHMAIPQLKSMYEGDQARKKTLIKYGFRLPSALDNRPLKFAEFEERRPQAIYLSATPGPYEIQKATHGRYNILARSNPNSHYLKVPGIVEQLIRPTGLLDPRIEVRPIHFSNGRNQAQDLAEELEKETKAHGKALVITLTKRLAEDVAEILQARGIKAVYMHSDIKTFDRADILKKLRQGKIDVIVGINLLREGLDLPEVTLVAILDADKEGFLRNETSFIQTMGRAARHPKGRVILYADEITQSIERAIKETARRRKIQEEHNKQHNIIPTKVRKAIREDIIKRTNTDAAIRLSLGIEEAKNKQAIIEYLKKEMRKAAKNLDFEKAARLRDEYRRIEKRK